MPGERPSVLIVEDEPRLRDMLSRAASELGFTAQTARSAEQAQRALAEAPPSIVLLDLNLPGMGGLEFLESLRREQPNLPVIILTGFGSLDAARTAIRHDVVDFLTKPCSLSELERALSRAEQRDRKARLDPVPVAASAPSTPQPAPGMTLEDLERVHILAALERHGDNRAAAAAELGISERTLYYRLARYQRIHADPA